MLFVSGLNILVKIQIINSDSFNIVSYSPVFMEFNDLEIL